MVAGAGPPDPTLRTNRTGGGGGADALTSRNVTGMLVGSTFPRDRPATRWSKVLHVSHERVPGSPTTVEITDLLFAAVRRIGER